MKSALLDAFPRADGKAMRQTALMTFLLCAGGACLLFLNLTFSGASVMFNAAKGADAQIASGVYLQPFYRVRGAVSVPILVGLLSAAALSLTGALLSALLGIKRLPLCAMLAGALALFPPFSSPLPVLCIPRTRSFSPCYSPPVPPRCVCASA